MKKRIPIIITVIILLWAAICSIDYLRVTNFEKPLFCISRASVYQGAENYRHCQGLGYAFEITDNPLSDAEDSDVTSYTYFLFGKEISSGIRD